FDANKKELKGDRKALGKLKDSEGKKLDDLGKQRAQLQAAYDATVDPLTGQGDPALQLQLGALDQRTAQVRDSFDGRIAAGRAAIDKVTGGMGGERQEILDTRKEIRGDRRDVKHDQKTLAHARDRVHDVRHRALKDLTPAEYKMGLH